MKRKTSFAVAIWWVLACAIAGIFLMCTSEKESRVSEAENRMLQGFPKLSLETVFNDEFTTQFDAFLADSFFGRDGVVSFTNGLLDTFSVLSKDDAMAAKTAEMESDLQNANLQVEEEVSLDQIPGVVDTSVSEAAPAVEEDEPEEDGELIVADGEVPITADHSYLYFEMTDGSLKKIYTYDRDDIATYADTLRIMQGYLPADGNILFTQVPLASIANRWSTQQDEYAGWGSSVEMMLEDCLQGTERIHVFSTYDILEPYITGDTPMFYTTDHHWSAEGAYKVAAEMFEKLGLPVIPYEEYSYKSILSEKSEGGVKDTFNVLYPLLPAHSYIMTDRANAEEIDLMNYSSTTYRSFMNNTRLPWRKIDTGANTGRKCLVLCDSFGNAFTPYLLPYYDEVHMADFRKGSYSKSQAGGSIGAMIQYHGIDDVYIITSTANGLRKENSIVYLREYLQN
ncbi:MAG: hypothetical protein IJ466_08640 [Clostridia bacterium]|nr:hypothetical protein [Clostridia bacterium]